MLKTAILIDDDLANRMIQLNGDLICAASVAQALRDERAFPIENLSQLQSHADALRSYMKRFGVHMRNSDDVAECFPSQVFPLTDAADFLTKFYLHLRSIHHGRQETLIERRSLRSRPVVNIRKGTANG